MPRSREVGVVWPACPTSPAPRRWARLRASGWRSVPVKDEIRRNAVARIASGEQLIASVIGYEDTVLPQLENAAGRARRDLPGRAGAGQDPHHPLARRPARRVAADRRRQRDQRRPLPPGVPPRPRPHRRPRRRDADRLGPPRPALRREAGHARHVDRRPHRRGRPHQGGRGPLPVRRADHPLRARAPHQPGHLRHQRAARPGRAHPGGPAQRAGGAGRPGPGLQDPPAPRRRAGGVGQPRRTTRTGAGSSPR